MSSAVSEESLEDGDRRCTASSTLSDADLTSCVTLPDIRIPSCSMTYQLNSTVTSDFIVKVYGQNLTEGLRNIGVKPIPRLDPVRNLLSHRQFVDAMPWKSCDKYESEIDKTESMYLNNDNIEMVTFLCTFQFQTENYMNIVFLVNEFQNLHINLCEVKICKRT